MANFTRRIVLTSLLGVVCAVFLNLCFFSSWDRTAGQGGVTWAVLVAGSSDFDDLRHQADICAAYHLLKRGGLSDKNLIVMMFDSVVIHASNPPKKDLMGSYRSFQDLCKSVPKHYTGSDVSCDNLIAVLTRNKTAAQGRKVIKGNPNDHVFLYYAGHGDAPHLDRSGMGGLNYLHNIYAEVSHKSLQGWYPILYRAFTRNTRTRVGNQVIIHIDYDHAIDVLIYLMSDESDKKNDDDDVRKRKLSLEHQEKLSKILRDIENRSKGMPLSKKMDLMREYPDINQGIGIMDQIFSLFRGSKSPPKEIATLMSCKKGLLVLLEAPGFKTGDRLSVRVENEWLIVEGVGKTTAGFKALNEKVEIAHDQGDFSICLRDEKSDGQLFPCRLGKG